MPKRALNDLTGRKFGRLLVSAFLPDDSAYAKFECICDCGSKAIVMGQSLVSGRTVSCGCYWREVASKSQTSHGQAGKNRTGAYQSWAGMMDRCEWGGHPSYAQYGAVGIRVDPKWHNFEAFYADMGDRPDGASIDRWPDFKGCYGPGNCRWATSSEQNLNKVTTKRVVYCGETIPASSLCDKLGLSITAMRSRVRRRGGDWVAAFKSVGINVSIDDMPR